MRFIFILILFHVSFFLFAKPIHFEIKDANQRNQLDFTVEGLLERTVGISHFISGWIEVDPSAVAEGIKGGFELDMRAFETGTELKNLFIREKILDAGQFPIATVTFNKINSITKGRFIDGEIVTAKIETQINLKGVSKNQIITLKLGFYKEGELSRQRLSGNLLVIAATFELFPSQWGIILPSTLSTLMSKSVQVNAHLVGSDKLSMGAANLPEGPKPKEVVQKNSGF